MEESTKQVWTRRNSLIPTSEALDRVFQLLLDQSHCQHWEIRIFLGAACAVVGRISSVDIPLISSVPLAIIIAFLLPVNWKCDSVVMSLSFLNLQNPGTLVGI